MLTSTLKIKMNGGTLEIPVSDVVVDHYRSPSSQEEVVTIEVRSNVTLKVDAKPSGGGNSLTSRYVRCKCGAGIDTDGDGNCGYCAPRVLYGRKWQDEVRQSRREHEEAVEKYGNYCPPTFNCQICARLTTQLSQSMESRGPAKNSSVLRNLTNYKCDCEGCSKGTR